MYVDPCAHEYSLFGPPSLTATATVIWAVERKRFDTITRFLENGADINNDRMFHNYVDQEQFMNSWPVVFDWHPQSIFTPLALAATLGLDGMVAFLLDHGADIEKPGKGLCVCGDGENQAQLCFPPCVGCRIPQDADYVMDDENGNCWTPLHFALCRGHESTAMVLLGRGANPKVTCPCDEGPWNALHTATRLNQQKIIDYLLDNKLIDINEGGCQGLTPLHLAFYEEHYSLVDMYIDRGADINAVWNSYDGGWTVFGMACLRDDLQRASDLLRRGADPELILSEQSYGTEWTALGLIYGNLFADYIRICGDQCIVNHATDTRARRMLEQQIIQAKVDKALQQRRKEDTD